MKGLGYRPLTEREYEFLAWLLTHSAPEARSYLPQLDSLQARSSCGCGCPSIALSLPEKRSAAEVPAEIVADFTGDSDGLGIGLILFASEGVLTELEVYPFEDSKKPFGLPAFGTLSPVPQLNDSDSTVE